MTDFIIPKRGTELGAVAKYANLQNVRIFNSVNQYIGAALNVQGKDTPIGISSLGTPIYTDLTLMGLSYTDNLSQKVIELPNDRFRNGVGSVTGSAHGGGFYMNIETVLITVEQPIRVIKTEIQGRNGTVKEYIGADDSRITINGVITSKNGVYPREETKRLKAWLDAPVAKGIVAWWLDNLGISSIVIENYSIPQTEGYYSQQFFSIQAVSDLPVELKITQPIQ